MLNKVVSLVFATVLAVCLVGNAFGAVGWTDSDSELFRVVYSTGSGATTTIVNDLGSIGSFATMSDHVMPGTAFSYSQLGASANADNTYAVYFAKDNKIHSTTYDAWAASAGPLVCQNRKFTTLNGSVVDFRAFYGGQDPNTTGTLAQYQNKFGNVGNLNLFILKGQVEYPLASLAALKLYKFSAAISNTFPSTDGVDTGIVIVTNADGSTTINPGTTGPDAPTNVSASAGDTQATVTFDPPASDGGSAITGYRVTSIPEGITATGSTSPITVTHLTNGTTYTFTVQAINAVASSVPSAPSNSVIPGVAAAPPGAPTIGTATAGDAQATVSFTAPASSGSSEITEYLVTSTPSGFTASGPASPIIITGLSNGTSYTFTVQAKNTAGLGPASADSNSVTPAGITTIPGAPTAVTATEGDRQATVGFNAPVSNGGKTITGYTVTSSPGGITATGSTSPITVTGLTNGTSYTFTVFATNDVGPGAPSAHSNSIIPAQVPGAPVIGSATAGNHQATVSFAAPASDGGSAITGYLVTSNDGIAGAGTSSPITVSGLANGTGYTFTVRALNAVGAGPASAASNSVTPAIPLILFSVSPSAGANGSMNPATVQSVAAGKTASFTLTANSGYQISAVTGCGGTLNGSVYTTAGVTGNCEVQASFIAIPPLRGDLNGDGKIDIADALLALQIAVGTKTATATMIAAGDVAPLVNRKPGHDGKIDIADAVAILMRSLDILNW